MWCEICVRISLLCLRWAERWSAMTPEPRRGQIRRRVKGHRAACKGLTVTRESDGSVVIRCCQCDAERPGLDSIE